MYKLKSEDNVILSGRGIVYMFSGIKSFDPRVLLGQIVDIDGHACKVEGVETYAVLDATGHNFGLLIKG